MYSSERMKILQYADQSVVSYFWRTTQQQEIDLIEEHEGSAWKAFEFKWKGNERVRFLQTFTDNYPGA